MDQRHDDEVAAFGPELPPAARLLRLALARARLQMRVVGEIGQAAEILSGDVDALARLITERAAQTVGCERVNVWLFDEDEATLRCIDAYTATTKAHVSGLTLSEAQYQAEFHALKHGNYIAAERPLSDPRTRGYADGYLRPLGITSMLDTVIQISGKRLGLLCFEHVGKEHHWERDEIAFAEQLADKLGLALVSRARREAEAELRASEEKYRGLVESSADFIWEVDADFRYTYVGPQSLKLLGYTPAELLGRTFFDVVSAEEATRLRAIPFAEGQRHRGFSALENRVLHKDGHELIVESSAVVKLDEVGIFRGYRGIDHDITERKRTEEALAYRDQVLHAIMDSTVALVAAESLAEPLETQLRDLAAALKLDRLLVMRGPGAQGSMGLSLFQAWQSPSVPLVTDAVIASFTGLLDGWVEVLAARRILFNDPASATGAGRDLLTRMQIRSNVMVPIVVSGEYWGQISADDCRTERAWNSAEIDALKTLAEIVGVLLYREQVRASLQQSEERFRAVSETAQDAIIIIDSGGRIAYWNHAAEHSLGYTKQEALGRPVHEIMASESDAARALEGLRKFTQTGQGPIMTGVRELTARRKDGMRIPIELSVSAMRLRSDWHAVAFMRDITERKRSESFIQHLARHDALTELPNRRVFVEALGDAIVRARREGSGFAVLYLDLDHFKDINDTLGHPVGDLVLKEVAARLLAVARATDTVARFGGDEFAILQAGLDDPADAAAFAERILTSLTEPMLLDGNEIRTGTSVGIAVYDASSDAEKLLSQADVALYRAKSEGRGTFRFFTESMDEDVHRRVRLGAELRHALAANELFLLYQPQVDVATGRIVGVEALMRWQHPERGLISPADFIPVAEQTGLIVALGQWALREACRQAQRWLDAGVDLPLMAINLSGLQFKSSHDLQAQISDVLAETGLAPQRLELELTESILMDASKEHNDVLLGLRATGFRLAIDDFGTGYSSLEYLRRFPVDRIKIAQDFISELTSNSGDAVIVKAALGIARELQLPAIVEGVETAEQLRLLREWGCREVQGYHYAPPLPPDAAAALLRKGYIMPGEVQAS